MAKNCGDWGRDKAKARYAEGGKVEQGLGANIYDKSTRTWHRQPDKPRVGPFPATLGEQWQSKMPSGPQDSYKRPEDAGKFKDGGPVESPPLVPSEWPPHPLRPKGKK